MRERPKHFLLGMHFLKPEIFLEYSKPPFFKGLDKHDQNELSPEINSQETINLELVYWKIFIDKSLKLPKNEKKPDKMA